MLVAKRYNSACQLEIAAMNNNDQELIGSPTVLIVDDEELMREVTSIMIEDNGGQVVTAFDGQNAVDVFQEKGETIDVICLDFSMPRLNGYEAYLKIRELSSDVGFVMVSGLQVTPEVQALREKGDVLFLAKPFHEVELLEAINTVNKRS